MGGLPRLPGGDFHIAGWVNDPPDDPLAPNILASDLVGAGLVVLLESRGDRCRMNCTSWLYSPHLASTCKHFFMFVNELNQGKTCTITLNIIVIM